MNIKFLLAVSFFVFALALPTVVQAACPAGLEPVWTTALPMCQKVYRPGDALPVGCTPDKVDNYESIECHPELHASFLLPGQSIYPGGCESNPPGQRRLDGSINPNCGWIVSSGSWVWNGPGPTPTTPPPPLLSGQNYACWGIESVLAGSSVYSLEANGGVSEMSSSEYLTSHKDRLGFFMQLSGCAGWEQFGTGGSSSNQNTGGNNTGNTNTGNTNSGGTTGNTGSSWTGLTYIRTIIDQIQNTLARISNPSAPASNVGSRARDGVSETATVRSYRLNVRTEPNTQAAVIRQLSPFSTFTLSCYVIGEMIEGSNKWWKTVDGGYVWGGGVIENSPLATQCAADVDNRSR